MNRGRLILTILVLLFGRRLGAQGIYQPELRSQHLETRYRDLSDGSYEVSLGLRYRATETVDVGWRAAYRKHSPDDPRLSGERWTLGLVWAYSRTIRRIGLRFNFDPWLSLKNRITDKTTGARIRLPYGTDWGLFLNAPIRLGGRVRVFPGLGVSGKVAHSTSTTTEITTTDEVTTATDIIHAGTDSETGWNCKVPMSIRVGARKHLTLEAGLFRPWRSAIYLGKERMSFTAVWSF